MVGIDKFHIRYYYEHSDSVYGIYEVMHMRKYPRLEQSIISRGIKRTVIADTIGISSRCLYNKLSGKSPLYWSEACTIQANFFPDIEKDYLFETAPTPGQ